MTLRLITRTVEIIDSQGLVDWSVSLSLPVIPSRVTVSVSSIPSRSDAAAPGSSTVELDREPVELLERTIVVSLGPSPAKPRLDGLAIALGEMVKDIAFLVLHAALNGHVVAEHPPDRFTQCLRSVDDQQQSLLDVQAAVDEIGQQRGGDGSVLG